MSNIMDKLDRIVSDLETNTGVTKLLPGTKLHQLAQSTAKEQDRVETRISDFTKSQSILYATGIDLDNIGEKVFGIPRLEAVKPFITQSMKALKFYVAIGTFGDINRDSSNVAQNIIIPEGTLIEGYSQGTLYVFRTSSQVELPKNVSEFYIDAEMSRGAYGVVSTNTLTSHSFTDYTQSVNRLLLVTNPVPLASGREGESDDNYRFRLSRSLRAFAKTNFYGVYDAAISVPGVSGIEIVPSSNGGGTLSIYVQGITPITADEVIYDVEQAISAVVPPWTSVAVLKRNYIGLDITFEVTSASSSDTTIAKIVSESVSTFINNFYGSELTIRDIIDVARSSHPDIFNIAIKDLNIYSGDQYRTINPLGSNLPDSISLVTTEKLIVEPIPNAIKVSMVN